jgi:8-oxo-dGTP diphosphatase
MTEKIRDDGKQVIAAVIERKGNYLVCQRPAHKRHGNLWEFPGGKIEPGETLLEAAQRELKEELALNAIQAGRVRLAVPDTASGFTINFVDVQAEGEPQLLEHNAIQWLSPSEMLNIPLAPSDRLFAEYLGSNGSAESD